MIRYFLSLILILLITSSSVVWSANTIETKFDCCCATVEDNCDVSNLNINDNFATISNDHSCDHACCVPFPNNKPRHGIIKVQISPLMLIAEPVSLVRLNDIELQKRLVIFDGRRPLHLASNQLYLKKRVLLI